jgi:hypothetical protein
MTQSEHNVFAQFAQCEACWRLEQPDRQPTRAVDKIGTTLSCAWCGQLTNGGILRRVRRHQVNFPDAEIGP